MAKSSTKTAKKPTGKSTSRNGSETAEAVSADPMLLKFFTDGIRDIYWAEKKLVTALPKMQKAASSPELQTAIEEHVEVTKEQVARLEQVFELLDENPRGKKCEAMEGLIKEGESVLEDTEEGSATRDAGIVISSQKIEHYEIAAYGGLAQLARTMGLEEVASILATTLDEEKQADETLTNVAENSINYEAAIESE